MPVFHKIKIALFLGLMITSFCSHSQIKNFKVTLDAGHGAHDFGATYNGHVEKNIALAVVLKVGKMLEENPKVDVTYTRKTDVFIDLVERANIANKANANIFVSIHCNASKNTAAYGTETYVMGMNKIASNLEAAKKENSVITLEKDYKRKYEGFDPDSPETMIGMTLMQEEYLGNSISLASKVENEFEKLGKKIRGGGVKQAPFMVLHKAYMPRVLIEMGFISNYTEGNLLDTEEGQNEIANAIHAAIISYKNEYYGDGTIETYETRTRVQTPEKPNVEPVITKNNPVTTVAKPSPEATTNAVVFKIQIAATGKKVALEAKNFKGLSPITMEKSGTIYKYMYGETTDYNQSRALLEQAKTKGYTSAFLIAFKDGKKISIQEAINY
ncbi:N-acetylmuramoyl-L-alanine amidase family protein [Flavobacterium crassostreae]|uniref:N-acetylmuramoyl-L-alanine amidase n=1 Tax=Flavobacterium crassostreae TaxID=1763534 RepID=A0A1B9DYV4_9FLAO|nr:N-acetylmuramoyl-L-alanine amidase [Flavobacterium crassostreae]OCB74873.1 N-acetylmuramoyl-L-alanine amidase [Flavobacterium crassostreae]